MTDESQEALLSEYKRYVRFDFFVIYGLAVLYVFLRCFADFLVPKFQRRFVEPRKERLARIKKELSIENRKKAFSYFSIHYAILIVSAPAIFTLFTYLWIGPPNYKYYVFIGTMMLIACSGFIAAYYGIVEGQEMDSMIWAENGFKKKNDPKERLKHPF